MPGNPRIRASDADRDRVASLIDATGPVEEVTSRAMAALRPFVR